MTRGDGGSRSTPDELEIIRTFIQVLGQPKPPLSRIGDDVAHFPVDHRRLVVKSDMLVGKTDVPKAMSLTQAARKSVVMCVSDFAAKGVRPRFALVSLGFPRKFTRGDIQRLARGFKAAAQEYGLEVIGGDTNECDDLVIDCTMLGLARRVVERSGARPRDLVVVSGYFGYSAAGLKILLEQAKARDPFRRRALAAVLHPSARLGLGVSLAKKRYLSSAIDSSDGLAISLHELAFHGRVGVELDWLPTTTELQAFAADNGYRLTDLTLHGGEEYEIVGTLRPEDLEPAREVAEEHGARLIRIGQVVEGKPSVTWKSRAGMVEVEKKGWVHFR